ncbi:MAG: metallophosphoesterase [Bacteroidetes bacterium]|nr:metallophosphoesterase [Bacteroidota bacterium]MBS1630889.1 metallophosphoesterase [Bacteroidota bacterium]
MPPFQKYKQARMVNWYHPKMLLNIGLRAVISGTFGNYADRRELEAALDIHIDIEAKRLALRKAYCEAQDDIWIDVVSDTGDGFNSTFAVARSVTQKELNLEWTAADGSKQKFQTQRGRILLLGGDEVYPFPSLDAYTDKFRVPFEAAAQDPADLIPSEQSPHLYAIPGNHDWYDGLGNFIKLFCQQRHIGIWATKQTRSYFALPLPNNYWVWATDIQLNSDIDTPQLEYFRQIAKEEMQTGDKVILLTAEPAWVYAKMLRGNRSFEKLNFFINRYIRDEKGLTGHPLKLAATLTGDLHHYSRYQRKGEDHGHQFITAGGGGAFLHLTHNLPQSLDDEYQQPIHQQCIFPNKKDSRKLLLWNLAFPFKNVLFAFLLFGIYLCLYIIFHNARPELFNQLGSEKRGLWACLEQVIHTLLRSPGIMVFCIAIAGGFYAFADKLAMKPGIKLVGALHGLSQLALLLFIMAQVGIWAFGPGQNWLEKLWLVPLICALGAGLAATLFGVYLYGSNRWRDMHVNEASSSLACEDFKNFLRLHVHKDGLTIYPIGIRRVPRHWETLQTGDGPDNIRFRGTEEPKPFLIEAPIHILNDNL